MTANENSSGAPGVTSEWDVELQVIDEYAQALAYAAEACFKHHGRMEAAREHDRRDPLAEGPSRVERIRAELRGTLRRTIASQTISLAVLDGEPGEDALRETYP